ncbi:hypothetical protein [Cohnella thailandensis]|uniref:Uncharacterized protein n=1 Tax=Cohnella thailandensis TaxID=557557 RepID=A0A841SSC3_9BACL|nr:hypothetical protein [Cohnella thailandensis]MBB6634112.1 hypothetical protein [Cohnella thailandensis]MBP1972395.1 hypothetical protein [Cohnella thailandensis]
MDRNGRSMETDRSGRNPRHRPYGQSSFARTAGYVCLGLAVLTAMGMVFFFLMVREHEEDRERERLFPWPERVASVRVLNSDGTERLREFRDAGQLEEVKKRLGIIPRTYFEEPEPSGTLYRIELLGDDEREAVVFLLSDLRESGGGGKIYPPNPEKNEVWKLSPDTVGYLVDAAEPA